MGGVLLWLWNNTDKKWEKYPSVVITVRKTAVGQVVAGKHKLYWVVVNPSAANSNLELTDATAGGGTLVMDMFFASKQAHLYHFNPAMQFSTGIYLETYTNITSAIFGYV